MFTLISQLACVVCCVCVKEMCVVWKLLLHPGYGFCVQVYLI